MEIPRHRCCSGGQEKGQGRSILQGKPGGGQGQGGSSEGCQDCQENSTLSEDH